MMARLLYLANFIVLLEHEQYLCPSSARDSTEGLRLRSELYLVQDHRFAATNFANAASRLPSSCVLLRECADSKVRKYGSRS